MRRSVPPRCLDRDGSRYLQVVPDFAASDAGLNLVTRGSGSNVKLFEYLAARLPVISTVFGVRGTELTAGADWIRLAIATTWREVIQRFISTDRVYWQTQAASVWNWHKHSCDIQNLVNDAISLLPDFGN